jgi:hypothetical protein
MVVAQFPVELLANAPLMSSAIGCLVQIASVVRNGSGRVAWVVFGMLLGPERTRVVRVGLLGKSQCRLSGKPLNQWLGRCLRIWVGVLVVV